MPASTGRYFVGVGRRHLITMRGVLLIIGSIRRIREPQHQAGTKYSAAECTKAKVAVFKVMAPALQLASARRLIKKTLEVSFLRSDFKCRRYVSNLSSVTPSYFGIAQKSSGLPFQQTSNSCFTALLLRYNAYDTILDSLSFNFYDTPGELTCLG